jgi:hypothetical protein
MFWPIIWFFSIFLKTLIYIGVKSLILLKIIVNFFKNHLDNLLGSIHIFNSHPTLVILVLWGYLICRVKTKGSHLDSCDMDPSWHLLVGTNIKDQTMELVFCWFWKWNWNHEETFSNTRLESLSKKVDCFWKVK